MSSEHQIVLQDKPSVAPIIAEWAVSTIGLIIILLILLPLLRGITLIAYAYAALTFIMILAISGRSFIDLIGQQLTTYTLTETHIIKQYGIVTRRTFSSPTDRSSVYERTRLFGRIFNYSTLIVKSTGLPTIYLSALPNAQQWQAEINKRYPLTVKLQTS